MASPCIDLYDNLAATPLAWEPLPLDMARELLLCIVRIKLDKGLNSPRDQHIQSCLLPAPIRTGRAVYSVEGLTRTWKVP